MATAAVHELLPLLTSWPFASLLSFLLAVAATVYLHSRRSDGDTAEEKNAVTAALTGFLNSFKKSAAPRTLPRSSYPDKVVLVTGANTGLGYGIAQRLAELQCTVIVACRSNPEETAASLRAASGNPNVSSAYVDLSDVRSVHGLADALLAQRRAIDCAVLNAAVLTTSSKCGPALAFRSPVPFRPLCLTCSLQSEVQAAAGPAVRGQRRRQRHPRATPLQGSRRFAVCARVI